MVYIERELEKEIKKYMKAKEILAVVGARQCGKTTLVNKILAEIKNKKIRKITFDNQKDLQLFETDIDSFIDQYVEDADILFIDEVQYSKESGKKLKYIHDNFKIKIIISGSSAAEISIHSMKYLVGRILTFTLYPLTFREFLSYREKRLLGLYDSGKYREVILKKINNHLEEFILYGGYPRVVLAKKNEKQKILEAIFNTYLLKEIKEILDLSNDFHLINLLKALSLQIGNIVNYEELSQVTGFSYNDLKKYLNILEKTYICSLVSPFYTNKRTEIVKSPKIYFFDTGFRNICIDNFSKERQDKGFLYENFIFSEIIKKGKSVKYWNTKSSAEVDFIIEKSSKVISIEVKSLLKTNKVPRSMMSFIKKYKPTDSCILSLDFEEKMTIEKTKIKFLPFVKFTSKNCI